MSNDLVKKTKTNSLVGEMKSTNCALLIIIFVSLKDYWCNNFVGSKQRGAFRVLLKNDNVQKALFYQPYECILFDHHAFPHPL